MKLIVGLGNYGKQYDNTRHNIGFFIVDNYLKYKKIDLNWKSKFNGLFIKTIINNEICMFLKPQKYMNLSGEVIKKYCDYYNINISDILIICDDLDLFLGNFKIKSSGSSGGHNGLKNIELCLNSKNYKRIKIGISNNKEIDTKDYVLGRLNNHEKSVLNDVFNILVNVLDDYFILDFDKLIMKYNKKNK